LVSSYRGLWFFPSELRRENKSDRFLWGVSNWELKSPKDKLNKINTKIEGLKSERAKFKKKIYQEGYNIANTK